MIKQDRIVKAAKLINPIFLNTPQYQSFRLSKLKNQGKSIAIIITGGNINPSFRAKWLTTFT